jgi:hypothetical protein
MRGMSLCSVNCANLLLNCSTLSLKLVFDNFFASSFSFSIFRSKWRLCDAVRCSILRGLDSRFTTASDLVSVGGGALPEQEVVTEAAVLLEPLDPPEPFSFNFPPMTRGFFELTA